MTAASDYYAGLEGAESDRTREAKAIVWYDQETPLYVCEACHEHALPLRFAGDVFDASDYEERRAAAYSRLIEDGVACDVCGGCLPEKVAP
ncbi:hypothetical protein [Halobacterium litoreum]|uniref:Small CPxCG-related zinc finger protein n=1 Tax=Halobacterium litoreum TaxID=2039234 RepID=A0ABD5NHB0_9EURY|nr:hypothetical protein [Halobacterium litoreum]UHH12423.1 hypothetical protein LT972_09660 [Halobacterium litoreum]